MTASEYELITEHMRLQTLDNCELILGEWDGFGNIIRSIKREKNKIETRINEIKENKE